MKRNDAANAERQQELETRIQEQDETIDKLRKILKKKDANELQGNDKVISVAL